MPLGLVVRMIARLAVPKSAPVGPVTSKAVVEGGPQEISSTSWHATVSSHPPFAITKLSVEPSKGRALVEVGASQTPQGPLFARMWLSIVGSLGGICLGGMAHPPGPLFELEMVWFGRWYVLVRMTEL